MSHRLCRLLIVLAVVLDGTLTPAQPPPPVAGPAASAGTPPAVAPEPKPDEPPVRRLYVPVRELETILRREPEGVLLSRDKFRQLYHQARTLTEARPRQPDAVGLTAADFVARVEDDLLPLEGVIRFTQFEPGWSLVRLPLGNLRVEQALLDGKPAPLARSEKDPGELEVLSFGAGAHELQLRLTTPLMSAGSDLLATVAVPQVPGGTLKVVIPPGKSLSVNGLTTNRPTADDQPADYTFAIGGQSTFQLRISDRSAAATSDALVFARTASVLQVQPGEVGLSSQTSVQVYGRPIDRLEFRLPATVAVTAVESNGLETWDLTGVGRGRRQQTQVTLTYRQPFTGERRVTLRGVFPTTDGDAWEVPTPTLSGADSQVSELRLRSEPGMRLQVTTQEGVRPLPAEKEQRGELRFQAPQPDYRLTVLAQPKSQVVHAAMTNLFSIRESGLDLVTTLDLQTHFVTLFDVLATLPADWVVTSVRVAGEPAMWEIIPGDPGWQQIRIPLDPPLAPGDIRQVDLTSQLLPEDWPLEDQTLRIPLPEVSLPQAAVVEALLGISVDAGLIVTPQDLSGLDPARPTDIEPLRESVEAAGQQLTLGFVHQDTAYAGQLDIRRAPATIAVATFTRARLEAQALLADVRADVTVTGGGVSQLNVTLPEAVGDSPRFVLSNPTVVVDLEQSGQQPQIQLRLDAPAIVEQQVSDPQLGRRTWTLRLDRRLRGPCQLRTQVRVPRTDPGAPVSVPELQVPGADRQNGWIAVEGTSAQRLDVTATGADGLPLTRVDPVDLPTTDNEDTGSPRRIVAGLRYLAGGHQTTIQETRLDRGAIPSAMGDALTVTSLLAPAGEWQHRAKLLLRATGVQGLQLDLPPGAILWAAQLDGRPIEVRRSTEGYLIPLPAVDQPDQPRELQLFYENRSEPLDATGRVRQTPPRIQGIDASGGTHPLEVLQSDWTLHYPSDVLLTRSFGDFEPTRDLDDGSLWGHVRRTAAVPSLQDLGMRLGIVGGAVLAAVLLALAWRKYRFWLLPGLFLGGLALLLLIPMLLLSARQDASLPTDKAVLGEAGAAFEQSSEPLPLPASSPFADGPTPDLNAGMIEGADMIQAPVIVDLTVPQQAAQPPAATKPAQAARTDGRGALLSLALDLETPPACHSLTLRTLSPLQGDPSPGIDLHYLSATFWQIGAAAVALGVALVYWWLRAAPAGWRTAVVVLSVFVPLALLPVVSSTWSLLTEGAFLGGIAGLLLWGLRALVAAGSHWSSRAALRWPGRASSLTGGLLLLLLTSPVTVRAGDAPDDPPDTTKPAVPTVIIPYGDGDPLESERVFLPQQMFRQLWDEAHPEKAAPQPAPQSATIAEALYAVDVSEAPATDRVRVSGRYVLYSFRAQPVAIPLPLGEVAVIQATLDDAPATLPTTGNGRLSVVLPTPGMHLLDVEFELPARLGDESGEFTLPLRPVPSGRLSVTLPAGDLDVRSDAAEGLAPPVRRRPAGDGTQNVDLPIDASGPLTLQWQPRTRQGESSFVRVDSTMLADVSETALLITSELRVSVNQGLLTQITLACPEELRLRQISGPDLGGWQMDGTGADRRLTLFLRREVDDETTLTAELFVPITEELPVSLNVPAFGPVDVAQETGQILIAAGEHLIVQADAPAGLTQMDVGGVQLPRTLAAAAASPLRLAYRFRSRPAELPLVIEQRPASTTAVAETGLRVQPHKTIIASRLRYEIRGVPTRTLRVLLSEDWLLTEVRSEAVVDWFLEDGELVLDLGSPRLGTVQVLLEATVPRNPTDEEAVLESPLPLEVTGLESRLAAWLDATYDGRLESHEGWRTIPPDELPADLLRLDPQPPQFAFRSSEIESELIFLDLTRATPQLAGDAVTLIAVSDVALDYGLTLRWRIERSATDTLVFSTPDWLEDRLELQGEAIRQISSTETPEGGLVWTVSLQEPVQGDYLLAGTATLPPPVDRQVRTPDIRFLQPGPEAEFTPLSNQESFAVLVNLSQDQLTPVDAALHDVIRPEALPLKLRPALLAQAMEIVRLPAQAPLPAWQTQHITERAGAAATVTVARLTTVLVGDGHWRMQAEYRVRNRGQQFLAVRLPPGSRVLSVVVRNQPAPLMQATVDEEPVALIPLPQTSIADLSFLATLVLAGELPAPLPDQARLQAAEVTLPAPALVTPQESREYGVPVVHTEWTVYLPEDLDASALDDAQRTNVSSLPEGGSELTTRLQQLQEMADLNRLLSSKQESLARKSRAFSNLRQLGAELRRDDQQLNPSGKSSWLAGQTQKYREERDELLQDAEQNLWNFENSGAANGIVILNGNANGDNGREFIASNSAIILDDNDGNGLQLGSDTATFRFGESPAAGTEAQSSQAPVQPGKGVQSRSELRGRLSQQAERLNEAATQEWEELTQSEQRGQGLGGGGFSGGAGVDGRVDERPFSHFFGRPTAAPAVTPFDATLGDQRSSWMETGGLSLQVDVPMEGEPLAFSKLGGAPRLTLAVRSRDTWRVGLRWVWCLLWLVLGGGWFTLRSRQATTKVLGSLAPVILVALGLFAVLLFGEPWSWLACGLLGIGILWLTLRWLPRDRHLAT